MVGASVVVILDPPSYRSLITPSDDGINETVGAAILNVVLSEPKA